MSNLVTLVGRLVKFNKNLFVINVSFDDPVLVPVIVTMDVPVSKIELNSIIGVKGHIEYNEKHSLIIKADKISFLSKGGE